MKKHHLSRSGLTLSFSLSLILGLSACGGSSSSSTSDDAADDTSTAQFATIDDLPQASDPVVSSASSLVSGDSLYATTGLVLSEMGPGSFDSDSSLAMCEIGNTIKSLFNEAVMGDLILCFVQNIFNNSTGDINIYDGQEHIFAPEFAAGEAFTVKLRITKDSVTDSVTDFQMWACEGGVQTEYISQTISGSDFTMTSLYTYNDEFGTGGFSLAVDGDLNSEGNFTSKTIASSYSSEWAEGGSGYGSKTVEQRFDQVAVSMFDAGEWSFTSAEGTQGGIYSNRAYGVAELLFTDSLATLAIGDGAASGVSAGTFTGDFGGGQVFSEAYEDDFLESFNGDTTAVDADGNNFTDIAAAGTIPATSSEPTIAFSGDQAWDCDDTGNAAVTIAVDESSVMQACSHLQLGWEWVPCWSIIESGN